MDIPWIIIIPIIIFWIIVITIIILIYKTQNKRINEIVDQEIKNNLEKLNYTNYVWKNNENYYNLKSSLHGCIMDNRKTFPSISKSYNNNSPTKKKEIYSIVKQYLELDINY